MHASPGLALLEEVARLGPLRREMALCTAPELHPGTAAVLWFLTEHEPMRMKDVAAGLHVDLSGVSRAVAELVARGQVERRADPADRRACLLAPTPAGRADVAAVLARLADRFADRFAACGPDALSHVAGELRAVREAWLDTPVPPLHLATTPET